MSLIDQSILDDLRQIDPNKIEKIEARVSDLESLPDGKYDIEIVSGEIKKVKETMIVFNFNVKVLNGVNAGFVCQSNARWIKGNNGLDYDVISRVVADFVTLGIPSSDLEGAGKFAANIGEAITKVVGRKAKAEKKTNESKGKTYHNLYINSLLPNDFKPSASAPAVMVFEQQTESEEGIPF